MYWSIKNYRNDNVLVNEKSRKKRIYADNKKIVEKE